MGKQMDIPAAEQIARLLAQVESLSRDNERLAADNAELARAAAEAARVPADLERELREELAAVRAERDRLVELVRLTNQRFFGCKSEKVVPDQLSLFNDMEAAVDPCAPEPEMPNAADPGDPAYLDSLMPWSGSVPEGIRLKPDAAAEAAKMADDPIIDIDPSAFSDDDK